MVEKTLYAAVRRDTYDGREFVLVDEIGAMPDEAQEAATSFNRSSPGYAHVNPVQRIARFKLVEDPL